METWEPLSKMKIGRKLASRLLTHKKIIVDWNLLELLPKLKALRAMHVFNLSKLELPPDASPDLVAKRLNEESKKTPNSAYLFITNSAKKFSALGNRNFDILLVPKLINNEICAAIKVWTIICMSRKPTGWLYRLRGVRRRGHVEYEIMPIKQWTSDKRGRG